MISNCGERGSECEPADSSLEPQVREPVEVRPMAQSFPKGENEVYSSQITNHVGNEALRVGRGQGGLAITSPLGNLQWE